MNHKVRDPFFRGDRQVDSMCAGFNTRRFDIDNGVSNFYGTSKFRTNNSKSNCQ